ncbi:helix-turn-helix transcriptional regulator [Planomonospora sp. ID67723]|uniref:helix-turn-helix domain-containing protein n=1 Tax=Planomonospora sp. ID67723 TaxID=2738134 RepID=UPI0018C362A8|nr:helix-turn-helix transcriptional regulator [Planomonospora sp. ID67723]MBG0830571.1 helix-turn-helix transcriptional regulator [Planomonospora sp. ID67723]
MPRRTPEPIGDRDTLLRSGPFHLALRACIRESGLSLDRIRTRLAKRGLTVALSTLSDWQRGQRRPGSERSMAVVTALEGVLGVPEQALTGLLRNDPGPAGRSGGPGPRARDVTVISQHQKVTLDAAGRRISVWARTLIRAHRHGVDRYLAGPFTDPGPASGAREILPLENCRLGEVRREPAPVAELLFEQVLRRGETWVFEWEARDHPPAPCTGHEYGFRRPVGQFLVEVRFDPAALPADCYSYSRRSPDGEILRTATLVPNVHHTVHLSACDVSSGTLGIAWHWPPS